MERRFRPDIEGLRAVAVLGVLAYHIRSDSCPGGFAGVDEFFVVSGYLITRLLMGDGERLSLREFYVRRIWRLLPALVVTVLATLVAAWRILGPTEYVDLAWSGLAALVGASNLYFFATVDYFSEGALHPLLHTWSLGVEEQFYLVWPALMLLAFRRRWSVLWLAAGAGLLSVAAMLVLGALWPEAVFYLVPFRMFELAAGACLASAPGVDRLPRALREIAGAAGAALILATFAFVDSKSAWPGPATLLPVVGTALLIAGGPETAIGRLLSMAAPRWVGRISYSLYLVHWPLITLARAGAIGPPGLAESAALAAASLVLGAVLYRVVEVTFRAAPRTVVAVSPAAGHSLRWQTAAWASLRPAGLAGLVACSTALAAAVVMAGGYPARLDRERVQMLDKGLTFAGDLCSTRRARCTFGELNATRTVYLVGDSHALNMVAGLDLLLKQQGWRGVALYDHGCLLLDGAATIVKGVPDAKCQRNIEETYALLAPRDEPVILALDWTGYAGTAAPAGERAPYALSGAAYHAWLEQRLGATIARLEPARRAVVVVKQTYVTGVDLARCLARPGTSDADCVPSGRSVAIEFAREADAAIDRVAAARSDFRVLDPKPVFCPSELCLTRDAAGALFFRDTAHLTNAGSLHLLAGFREELTRMLDPSRPARKGEAVPR